MAPCLTSEFERGFLCSLFHLVASLHFVAIAMGEGHARPHILLLNLKDSLAIGGHKSPSRNSSMHQRSPGDGLPYWDDTCYRANSTSRHKL